MENAGVTPEELLQDFGSLVEAQTKSLRGLASASDVGVETIRGWKDMGRFPRNTDDFIKVVQTCLASLKPAVARPRWGVAEWRLRYQEAKWILEDRESGQRSPKPTSGAAGGQATPPSVQVYGGDYVGGIKNAAHFGDVNHHLGPRGL